MLTRRHEEGLKRALDKLKKRGFTVVNLDRQNVKPDGLAIDWKNKKVFAVEIEASNTLTKTQILDRINSKYYGCELVPFIVILDKEKKENVKFKRYDVLI